MSVEIERKFLVANDSWRADSDQGTAIHQGYLNSSVERTVRVRIYGDQGFLTIKGKSVSISRQEFEYEIPLEDAQSLLKLCESPIIEKTRYIIEQGTLKWEIDVFDGVNKGLVVAEIELENEEQSFEKPTWLGDEVSSDTRYFNSSLISHPFCEW